MLSRPLPRCLMDCASARLCLGVLNACVCRCMCAHFSVALAHTAAVIICPSPFTDVVWWWQAALAHLTEALWDTRASLCLSVSERILCISIYGPPLCMKTLKSKAWFKMILHKITAESEARKMSPIKWRRSRLTEFTSVFLFWKKIRAWMKQGGSGSVFHQEMLLWEAASISHSILIYWQNRANNGLRFHVKNADNPGGDARRSKLHDCFGSYVFCSFLIPLRAFLPPFLPTSDAMWKPVRGREIQWLPRRHLWTSSWNSTQEGPQLYCFYSYFT